MINIIDKKDCVGCNACVQRCPKQCISMHEDEQGFLYPVVNLDECVDCHLCEKICPVINQGEPREPLATFAAKNPDDEVRMSSSSGGIFFALAKTIIDEGGVVFGAKFNENWDVVHDYAETIEGVRAFQGSKYVQSRIGETFIQVESFLKVGRRVMFTGTPCQIAALSLFLRKDYGDQLLRVDVVCHGVPSPLIWCDYMNYIARPEGASAGKNTVFSSLKEKPVITGMSFRDKRLGWEKYGFSARVAASKASGKNSVFQPVNIYPENIKGEVEFIYEPFTQNLYMQGFLKDLYLRPSCYACPVKQLKSGSDITLADFWGIGYIDKDLYGSDGYKGISLVLVNTEKGRRLMMRFRDWLIAEPYLSAVRYNSAIVKSACKPKYYRLFWKKYDSDGIGAIGQIVKKMKLTFLFRGINFIKRFFLFL